MQIRNWPYSKTDITNQKVRWFSIWSGIRPTLMTQKTQNLPTKQETGAQSLDCEDAIEKGMATHSSILAWRILRTKEPGGLQSMESQETDMTGWLTLYTLLMFHFSSVTQWCPTLCNPMDCSTSGFPVHPQLPEVAQTHVHQVRDAIQPSNALSSPSPPAFHLSQNKGLFQ